MKKILTMVLCLMALTTISAQNVTPKGLYRMTKLSYENGKADHIPEFAQYKFCSDTIPFTVMVSRDVEKELIVQVRQDEPHPYTFTGDVAVGIDGHGTRIFDCEENGFKLKWYNTVRPGSEAIFPMNEFITETYVRDGIPSTIKRMFEMLEMKNLKSKHRFSGSWTLVGAMSEVDGMPVILKQTVSVSKIYGEKEVVMVISPSASIAQAIVYYHPLDVKSEANIIEGKNDCKIEWKNKDCFILSFNPGDGTTIKELWKRSGLKQPLQTVFETHEPVFELNIPSTF